MDWVSEEFGLSATVGALTGVNQEYLDAGGRPLSPPVEGQPT
ncbi:MULTISPECIES: hypothetical protein [unclassified Rhodococcus (in: high G+C Gram-positive bacteria)]|nr:MULTISPECIES: hypothetical protein [unclassified Rhodococcus (in: high G+C Gram-positive bacteria)]